MMNRTFIAAGLATLFLGLTPASADHKGKITWVEDYAQGMQKAQQNGLPAMAFFTAEW